MQGCNLTQRQCVQKVQKQAMEDYDAYVRDQFTRRAAVELHPRDFERQSPCDTAKKECMDNCSTQHRACYENCGGTVDATSSCQFLCF